MDRWPNVSKHDANALLMCKIYQIHLQLWHIWQKIYKQNYQDSYHKFWLVTPSSVMKLHTVLMSFTHDWTTWYTLLWLLAQTHCMRFICPSFCCTWRLQPASRPITSNCWTPSLTLLNTSPCSCNGDVLIESDTSPMANPVASSSAVARSAGITGIFISKSISSCKLQ